MSGIAMALVDEPLPWVSQLTIRSDVLCSITGVGLQHIHLFASYRKKQALHCPYADAFFILSHDMFQSRFPERVVHLEAAGTTAEFLAWMLHYSSPTTSAQGIGLTILIPYPIANYDVRPTPIVGGDSFSLFP